MSLAVLDRPQAADGSWTRRSPVAGVLHGPLLCTVLFTGAALLLLTGSIPVADRDLVLAGLAAASAATGVAWAARRSRSVAGSVAVPAAQLGAVALLHAGTGSATTLLLLVGPLWALAMQPDRRGLLVGVLGSAAVLSVPAVTDPPGALLLGTLVVAAGGSAVHGTARRLAARSREIGQLEREQAALLAQVQSRADELDTASRILAARAQTMTSVIDAVTEQSIIGTDRDGTIRVWNPGAEKMLGVPRPDVVRTRSILDFHLPEELDAAAADRACGTGLEALVHAAREHGSDVRDWTYVAADGSHRTVSVAITPRSDDRGAHAGWNFVGTDMTEARATERMKDQFVSLISHELRTPLSSILGYLELVMDDEDQPLTDEQRQYLATVERNAQRLLRLVGDLLFTAQVESGRFTLQPADVDLAGVVRAAEETARVAAAAAGVQIVVDVPDDGLVVAGDAVRLGQACDNLVSNAVKFTPAGGRIDLVLRRGWRTPEGEVVDHRVPEAAPVALLSVADTGMGIPAGEQGQMFTRFFRTSNAQRNAVPGVGLGLTITKAITTAHGGTLDLESTEGVGTTFTMTLPVPG
ncbi:PAS domain-containing protein [Blastococcus sp. MG754426]|uniref:sensor histidine kinase n=1 Tax=unclassified Blastococcus TaxID=2619396 RepID=UPI001EF0FB30|nr:MULTISPECIES: ATP-binding protein [unclassified Blastococcus]MCF6508691.1 PAS domain-containing protein [Blastococcus sp. MG754426]MCF6513280.1 PAS domain-containing protein [Blastococcus sp. MG754427]MCF6736754.1 PAS domain-containing protein [Blastococcus sp. KM273129]